MACVASNSKPMVGRLGTRWHRLVIQTRPVSEAGADLATEVCPIGRPLALAQDTQTKVDQRRHCIGPIVVFCRKLIRNDFAPSK